MTTYPSVHFCARCGDLETAHELRTDGVTRGKRLGQTATSTGNELCAGWEPGRTEERPPEGVLRERLAAVLALRAQPSAWPAKVASTDERLAYADGWADATATAVRAARGES